jgi:hypothetical protein
MARDPFDASDTSDTVYPHNTCTQITTATNVGWVLHDRAQIIRYAVSGHVRRAIQVKVVFHRLVKLLFEDYQVLVTIRPLMFVFEAQRVADLMSNSAPLIATYSTEYPVEKVFWVNR